VIAALGEEGLRLALLSSFDHSALVRLANACGASVKGMRNQAVPADQLARSLVGRTTEDGSVRASVLRALTRSNRDFLADYRTWTPARARKRLGDLVSRPRLEGGRLLFALAREPSDGLGIEEIQQAAEVLSQALAVETPGRKLAKKAATVTSARAEARALRRENAELARRLGSVEGQLAKSQERLERARKELADTRLELRNLQLAQTRSQSEQTRAEREIRRLTASLEEAVGRKQRERVSDSLDALRGAASAQERASRALEKLVKTETARLQRDLSKAQDTLRREVAGQGKTARDRQEQLASTLVHVRKEVAALREEVETRSPVLRTAAKGEAARVGVYVDVQNVFYAARDKDARLDFSKLIERAARSRRLVRAVAYLVESKEIDQRAFINLLQSHAYDVKRKALKVHADGSMKGDWDLEMALDVLADAPRLDVVVLVTGDGDFTSLVQELKRQGPKVEVYSFPAATAKELREAADRFVPITRKMLIPLRPDRSGGGRARRAKPGGPKSGGKS
jgi:uncharacterized LabA/DUF88 family protein